jgi:hypothetical protein
MGITIPSQNRKIVETDHTDHTANASSLQRHIRIWNTRICSSMSLLGIKLCKQKQDLPNTDSI